MPVWADPGKAGDTMSESNDLPQDERLKLVAALNEWGEEYKKEKPAQYAYVMLTLELEAILKILDLYDTIDDAQEAIRKFEELEASVRICQGCAEELHQTERVKKLQVNLMLLSMNLSEDAKKRIEVACNAEDADTVLSQIREVLLRCWEECFVPLKRQFAEMVVYERDNGSLKDLNLPPDAIERWEQLVYEQVVKTENDSREPTSKRAGLILEKLRSLPKHGCMDTNALLDWLASEHEIVIDKPQLYRHLDELKPYGLANKKRYGYFIR